MVAPIIIAILVLSAISGVILFTPVGEILHEALSQTGFIDPNADMQQHNDEVEEGISGFEEFIHEMIDLGHSMGDESIDNSDFEDNPIGMTETESRAINDKGAEFWHDFADTFFSGHGWIVSMAYGFSPVDIALSLVTIIALIVTIVIMYKHGKHLCKHWLWIVLAVLGVITLLIVLGSSASI